MYYTQKRRWPRRFERGKKKSRDFAIHTQICITPERDAGLREGKRNAKTNVYDQSKK
jgi:hypothetical protein